VLHQHFPKCTVGTKSILLSTYAKMQNLYPEIRPVVGCVHTAAPARTFCVVVAV
jgi:hypothetical protein